MLSPPADLIGSSAAIRVVEDDASHAARSDAKVLIVGESGVGKEIVAHLIHRGSARRSFPFVTLNCAGIPDTLLESELFGHERGSFTGADREKLGLLEVADGGTVFLDEIGEMSPRMQGLLLRFLETGELQRVGSTRSQRIVDVRVIAATNRVLVDHIQQGAFRIDLYYRLNVILIEIPPLRQRREDVIPLAEHFLVQMAREAGAPEPRLSEGARQALMAYDWPGNVRELRNVVERMIVHGKTIVSAGDLKLSVKLHAAPPEEPEVRRPSVAKVVFDRIVGQGESFWNVAHTGFMARDLTRDDLRSLIDMGLEETRGSYKILVELFNMPQKDYKRFLSFLRKHNCHIPFQTYRSRMEDSRYSHGAAVATKKRA